MASNPLIFKDAEAVKNAIMDSQKKEIAKLYEDWADEIGERAKFYSHKSTASSVVSERQMKELKKQLTATSHEVSNEIYKKIKANIYTVSDAVVRDNVKWLESFGFAADGLNAAFTYVPHDIVQNLVTGQIYDSGWSLSARIWGDNEATLKDIYQVMAKGLAENRPIYDIAKELEAYVRPSAKLPWNLTAKDGVKIFKKQVDYNAQRLARTLVQHGYQQSFVATTQKNPFITEYIWRSNGSRVCELCKDRDGVHYKKDELPLDHPNGMCTMEPVVADNMVDQLANWFNSPDGTYPEIDEFAGNFGYNASKTGTVQDFINKYGTSTKNPKAWKQSLSPIQKAEAKLLKEQSGLTWEEWYAKNIYSGNVDDLTAWKADKVAKKAAKKATSKIDDAFDAAQWYEKVKANDLSKMESWTDDWLRTISSTDKDGVRTYTGMAYEDMNKYLRGIEKSTSYADEIKACKSALSKASLPEETIVRRGSDYNMLKELNVGRITPETKSNFIGGIVTDKGFVSTSPDPHGGFSGSIEYVIRVPQGSQAMYVAPISKFHSENELLINCGGKYMVEDVEFDSFGYVNKIYMALINLK